MPALRKGGSLPRRLLLIRTIRVRALQIGGAHGETTFVQENAVRFHGGQEDQSELLLVWQRSAPVLLAWYQLEA